MVKIAMMGTHKGDASKTQQVIQPLERSLNGQDHNDINLNQQITNHRLNDSNFP